MLYGVHPFKIFFAILSGVGIAHAVEISISLIYLPCKKGAILLQII